MNRLLAILFVAVIALPLAGNLAGLDGGDPEGENRTLAAFPHWDGSWRSLVAYPDQFSRWFEDHFAFRSAFVRWYGESRYFALDVSPAGTVLKGTEGWLYYADDAGVEDYANATLMTPGEVGAWHEALVRAHDWLHGQHVAFVFTIAPDKHVIYPEHVPHTIQKIRTTSRTDQVFAALTDTDVRAIDIRPALFECRTVERCYYQTDTHWNDRGALVGYQRIIEAVREQVPSVPPAWKREDFEPEEHVIEGRDLAGMIGLKHVLHETELSLVPKRPRRARVIEPAGEEPTAEVGRLVTEIPNSKLPRAVIFRDSFVTRLVPFLSEHFSRALYLWQNDFDANVVREEHPDVVIQEIVGRHLYGFIASPELVPR